MKIGDIVKVDCRGMSEMSLEDMGRYHGKTGVVSGIGDVLVNMVTVKIGREFTLFRQENIQ